MNPKEEANRQREQAKAALVRVFESAGFDMSLHQFAIDLFINHVITAAMLEMAIAQKEAIDRAQNANK